MSWWNLEMTRCPAHFHGLGETPKLPWFSCFQTSTDLCALTLSCWNLELHSTQLSHSRWKQNVEPAASRSRRPPVFCFHPHPHSPHGLWSFYSFMQKLTEVPLGERVPRIKWPVGPQDAIVRHVATKEQCRSSDSLPSQHRSLCLLHLSNLIKLFCYVRTTELKEK